MIDYDAELKELLHHAEEFEKEADEIMKHAKKAQDRLKEARSRMMEKVFGAPGHILDATPPAS